MELYKFNFFLYKIYSYIHTFFYLFCPKKRLERNFLLGVSLMPIYAYIFCESPITLWGLSSRQRLERVLNHAGVVNFLENLKSVPPQSSVLLIRADYLYDERVINQLVETSNVVLQVGTDSSRVAVAANVASHCVSQTWEFLNGGSAEIPPLPGIKIKSPETLSPAYQAKLKKSDPPFILPITETNRRELEKRLFAGSYKGVTDLVTKWVWPRPAQWCTKVCAHLGMSPNQVTFIGFVLVIIATVLFARGLFGWGLLAGWIMTFLDTVDGKLARVTITSSRFGHLFDHVIDLVHPPLWYVAWGLGLAVSHIGPYEIAVSTLLWVIIGGYLVGRLVELAFKLVGSFVIFIWRPVDSYFRLVTARRNPNLILLTAAALTGHGDLGLLAVAIWTAVTSLFLMIRLGMAFFTRITSGPLKTWMLDIDRSAYGKSLAAKLFTQRPAK
jgi:phosphatidylglycerophosphate synthase